MENGKELSPITEAVEPRAKQILLAALPSLLRPQPK
jgi:hypothetical protein